MSFLLFFFFKCPLRCNLVPCGSESALPLDSYFACFKVLQEIPRLLFLQCPSPKLVTQLLHCRTLSAGLPHIQVFSQNFIASHPSPPSKSSASPSQNCSELFPSCMKHYSLLLRGLLCSPGHFITPQRGSAAKFSAPPITFPKVAL